MKNNGITILRLKIIALILILPIFILSAYVHPFSQSITAYQPLFKSALPQNMQKLMQNIADANQILNDKDIYSVTSQNPDGSYTATAFGVPVKYINKQGQAAFIDTSIKEKDLFASIFSPYDYENGANSFKTEFSKNDRSGIRLTDGKHSVQMALKDTNKQIYSKVEAASDESILDDAFVYENAFGFASRVKYYNTNIGLKEDIILDKNLGINHFDFTLSTGDLTAELSEDRSFITIFNKQNPDETLFYLSPLYAYDSFDSSKNTTETEEKHLTEDCYYKLEETSNGVYTVSAYVSEAFLNNPQTVYPVTIDPSLTVANTVTNIDDTFVMEANANEKYYLSTFLRIGNYNNTNSSSGKCFSYVRHYTLPTLPAGNYITSSNLKLDFTSGQTTAMPASAFIVTSYWEGQDLTWSGRPTLGQEIASNVSHNNCTTYNFNVTKAVQQWYANSSNGQNKNYGVMINYTNNTAADTNRLRSSDSGVAGSLPALTINYDVTSTIADDYYYIKNLQSGLYLDMNPTNGEIMQYGFHGEHNQQWHLQGNGNRTFKLKTYRAEYSGQVINVVNGTDSNGASLKIGPVSSSAAQVFYAVANGDNTYRFLPLTSGFRCVDASANSSGAKVHLWEWLNATNQKWTLEKVQPDLTVRTIQNSTPFAVGVPVSFSAEIFNNFRDAGTSNVEFRITNSSNVEVFKQSFSLGTINGFTTKTATSPAWTPANVGDYTLTVKADVNNQVAERNESNNSMSMPISIVNNSPYSYAGWVYPLKPVSGDNIALAKDYSENSIGIYFKGSYGSDVYSVDNGTVLDIGYSAYTGYYVVLQTDTTDYVTGEKLIVRYAHLQSVTVAKNSRTTKDSTKIGTVGATGYITSPQLYFEVNKNNITNFGSLQHNQTIDPKEFWAQIAFTN